MAAKYLPVVPRWTKRTRAMHSNRTTNTNNRYERSLAKLMAPIWGRGTPTPVTPPPDQLNWIKVEFDENAVLDSAVLALHTLRRVFGCGDDDVVYAQFFRSPMQRDGGSGDSEMRPDGV